MNDEQSEVKVSASSKNDWLDNIAIHIRGTSAVVIIVSWIIMVGVICIFASDEGRKSGITTLTIFMGFYLGILSRK